MKLRRDPSWWIELRRLERALEVSSPDSGSYEKLAYTPFLPPICPVHKLEMRPVAEIC
jgi:hypothetical protein